MGISLVGHSPSFEIWVFNVNGKQFVGRNYSTQDPLQLSFRGVWDKYSGGAPLINTSGFNITESTDKVAVWTWRGKQYTSWWLAISADDEDPDAEVTLKFGPAVPYAGPPVSPVGTGGVSTPPPAPAPAPSPAPAPRPQPPVVQTPPTTASASPSGTDWVKLGLQLGAAYLLLS